MRGKLHAGGPDGDECAVIDADRAIAAIASRQRGVVTRTQLLAAGISGRAIERRLRAGRLHAVHRGIYLVVHRVMPDGARELAALLACGRSAVVSHLSAANLHQLLPYRNSAVFNQLLDNTVDIRNQGTGNCGSDNAFSTGDALPPC
jgi:predicted transcriptional regulator of viral defense system